MKSNISTSRNPAPYGRACTDCSRAKVKCVINDENGTNCERCLRLNKECQPSSAHRKRRTVQRPATTKTAQLEEKLDGLVTLLRSATQSTPIGPDNAKVTAALKEQPSSKPLQSLDPFPRHESSDESSTINVHGLSEERMNGYCPIGNSSQHSTNVTSDTSHTTSCPCPTTYQSSGNSLSCASEPSLQEADNFLTTFQTQMLQQFPLLILPASITSQELRQKRPFLWLCIMAVSSKSSAQQMALGTEIRLTLGRKSLLEGERSLDLLLGILTYAAWGQYHLHIRPILSNLVQLAMALIYDLGLNKPPPKEPLHMMLNYDARGCPKHFNPSPHTMEERRALICCFLVSSGISSYFQRIDALHWTPYLDECLQMLAEHREEPTDILLAQIVRLQLITEEVAQAPWQDGHVGAASSFKIPWVFYLKALQAQMQNFKLEIPPILHQNELLLLNLYSTELTVHEMAISKAPDLISGPDFQRLESLYTCLRATKSWFDLFLVFSPALYVGVSFLTFTQLAHCLIALYRLSTLDDPDWDLGLVRETLDLSLVLDQVVTKMAQVKLAAGLDYGSSEDSDVFSQNSRRIGSIKAWWDAKISMDLTERNIAAVDETVGEAATDFLDDAWLKDILGPWDLQLEPYMQ